MVKEVLSGKKNPMMLTNDVVRIFHFQMKKSADSLGIPSGYRPLLMHLAHADGITQLELAKSIHLTAPTVSVTLQKMEHDGFIERRADTNDQRQVLVFLTDKGKMLERSLKSAADSFTEKSLTGFSDAELADFTQYLERMYNNLSDITEGHE